MYKIVQIGSKKIPMLSNGGTLRKYRQFFKRDMLSDLMKMEKSLEEKELDTEIFENIAWTLAHSADKNIEPIDKWVDQFDDPTAIISSFEEVMSLIMDSNTTIVKPKKKQRQKMRK